ncbi:MAG: hypothetical protein H0Z38_09290 [Firmicutes bacterium]|nr:hypothetical protein [Bacillota bacterium]
MSEVPLIIRVFDNINFSGPFRTIISNLADFRDIEFNDRTSSIIVEEGPNFRPGDAARLWDNINFSGPRITLPPGRYPDLREFNFNDITSSLSIVRITPPPDIIAEDRQRETLRFNLRIIPPVGTTLVSVQQNRILNPTATGTFVGDTGVQINGSFVDEVVAIIRDSAGNTRTATGRATINFSKLIDFPEIAGLNKNNLQIRTSITNVSSSFTLSGNILSKTVQFDLTTQIVRLLTTELMINPTEPTITLK